MTVLETNRWSADRVNAWYDAQDWPCGFNYMPSTAVNFADMWHAETFDADRIATEMGWAEAIGYNSARVNIQFIQWKTDPKGVLARVDRFMDIAAKHGVSTVLCLFDDCGFSGVEPTAGVQPDPVPDKHNSRALASPGRDAVLDETQWPDYLDYVKDVVTTFADDPRILFWDLYNEPGNDSIFLTDVTEDRYSDALWAKSFALCKKVFAEARAINPSQPVTSAAWMLEHAWENEEGIGTAYQNEIDQFLLDASDIISFHAYCPLPWFTKIIGTLQEFGRPIMCTEWLARPAGSIMSEQLPLMHDHRIGAYQWGFVNGRSQTNIPWPNLKAKIRNFDATTSPWFHDVLREDGSPYDAHEMELVSRLTSKS
ncbi:1,4-beta-xylanase [Rhodophyticola sp. CCM32]|uniref:cellulase family glycosylhydrolase n=1 Tax=Rhodophyticola sp. CCM32 TaxID=2916397 RepID=UPI00107FBF82|nr:cellulase family glycosylhydrolase [Rhodophyticola sp. CCM32]QBY00107.1 1,4-beta-xylanase [Rhodophyticola sp. CCM32]